MSTPSDVKEERCDRTELRVSECGGPCHKGRSPQPRSYRVHNYGEQLLSVQRDIGGEGFRWYPHESGAKSNLNPRAGHVHICGGFGRKAIEQLIRDCPQLYLVTCAPTQRSCLERNLDLLRKHGIGAATLNSRGNLAVPPPT